MRFALIAAAAAAFWTASASPVDVEYVFTAIPPSELMGGSIHLTISP